MTTPAIIPMAVLSTTIEQWLYWFYRATSYENFGEADYENANSLAQNIGFESFHTWLKDWIARQKVPKKSMRINQLD